MEELQDNSVHLMITSPPYPMIEMWDEIFSLQNRDIKKALENGEGLLAFEKMNEELDKIWKEIYRVLIPGGIACINIGDAGALELSAYEVYRYLFHVEAAKRQA